MASKTGAMLLPYSRYFPYFKHTFSNAYLVLVVFFTVWYCYFHWLEYFVHYCIFLKLQGMDKPIHPISIDWLVVILITMSEITVKHVYGQHMSTNQTVKWTWDRLLMSSLQQIDCLSNWGESEGPQCGGNHCPLHLLSCCPCSGR